MPRRVRGGVASHWGCAAGSRNDRRRTGEPVRSGVAFQERQRGVPHGRRFARLTQRASTFIGGRNASAHSTWSAKSRLMIRLPSLRCLRHGSDDRRQLVGPLPHIHSRVPSYPNLLLARAGKETLTKTHPQPGFARRYDHHSCVPVVDEGKAPPTLLTSDQIKWRDE